VIFCSYVHFVSASQKNVNIDNYVAENEEDRKKMVSNVVTLLEKADNIYKQLNAHKPQLEALLLQVKP